MRCPCCQSEIAESVVLSEAARICVRRRKNHKGAALKVRPCRWCAVGISGREALDQHQRVCAQRPSSNLVEFAAVDLCDLVGWTPDDAA